MARGVSETTVQTLGRWASDSFRRYIRIPREDLTEVSKRMSANFTIVWLLIGVLFIVSLRSLMSEVLFFIIGYCVELFSMIS